MRGRVLDTLYAFVTWHGWLLTRDELITAVGTESVVEETNLKKGGTLLGKGFSFAGALGHLGRLIVHVQVRSLEALLPFQL